MIVVLGEILIDVFETYQRIGGAPFNFAFHLKQLGFDVRFLTRIGDDAHGRDITALLENYKFDLADVQVDPLHATGTVTVTVDPKGVPVFDICTDTAYDYLDLIPVSDDMDWTAVRMVYFGSLAQRTDGGFKQISQFLQKKPPAVDTFFDINLRPPHINETAIAASLDQTDILKLNDDELRHIKALFNGPPEKQSLIPWLMDRFGLKRLILTHGHKGSSIYTPHNIFATSPEQDIPMVDTVGAGDAYAAVMAAGHILEIPLPGLADAASQFAGQICGIPGAIPENTDFYRIIKHEIKG